MSGLAADEENTRIGKRLQRYASVGTSLGGFAGRLAARKLLCRAQDHQENALRIKEILGALKGPIVKAAQILATIPHAIPPEYASQLQRLQANAPPMGVAFATRRMAGELGADWKKKFRSFNTNATFAASLGQVHRAVSEQGERLACKLQYPDMRSVVEADLNQLKFLFSMYQQYDKAIDPADIHTELAQRLYEELDYCNEANNMLLYREILKDEKYVHLPRPLPELSTRRLLTMTWCDGEPLLTKLAQGLDLEARNLIAKNMFRIWYRPFYRYGVIHGDPHLGNYSLRKNADINLLDFGCVRVFRPQFVEAVLQLYRALEQNKIALAAEAYEKWGFKKLGRELLDALNVWARFLYGPLLEDRTQGIMRGQHEKYGAQVAARVHRQLRKLGGVRPPREFLLMDRAAVGLGGVFMHLKAEINWRELFEEVTSDFCTSKMAEQQRRVCREFDIQHT